MEFDLDDLIVSTHSDMNGTAVPGREFRSETKYNYDSNSFYNNWTQRSINYEIDFLQKAVHRKLWNNEYFNERIQELQREISQRNAKPILKDNKIVYQLDMSGKRPKVNEVKTNEFEVYENELQFKKPWQRLKDFHRLAKIKEYVDQLEYHESVKKSRIDRNRKKIMNRLEEAMKDKKFNNARKNSQIVYDQNEMKIKIITCVEYDKKKKKYVIDFD